MAKALDVPAIGRVLRSLLAAELAAQGKRVTQAEASLWQDNVTVDEEGLGVDSLGRLGCAAAVNAFFRLHEIGVEDYLLAERSLARWAEIVAVALAEGTSGFTFSTSGSTGEPKPCGHDHAALAAEAAHWAGVFAERERVIQLVPAHHLYGFMFTVLLPLHSGMSVLDLRAAGAGKMFRSLRQDDLIVAHPTALSLLLRTVPALPSGIVVVSSTAPLPKATAQALGAKGAAHVYEVYGSSETAGIASRCDAEEEFTLLPHWQRRESGAEPSIISRLTGAEHALPDRVIWLDERRFTLQGRKDGAVQVAGVNVFPEAIARRIAAHPDVAECAVRLDRTLAEPRLKAFVVPAPGVAVDRLATALERWAAENLSPPERPVRFDIGPALPRNDLGKLADWSRAA